MPLSDAEKIAHRLATDFLSRINPVLEDDKKYLEELIALALWKYSESQIKAFANGCRTYTSHDFAHDRELVNYKIDQERERIRTAALEEAAKICEVEDEQFPCDCHSEYHTKNAAEKIRALSRKVGG